MPQPHCKRKLTKINHNYCRKMMKNFDERVRTCPITILKKQIYFIFNSNLSNSNFATLYYTLNKSLRNPIYDIQIYFGNLEKNTWFQYSPRFLFSPQQRREGFFGKELFMLTFRCSSFIHVEERREFRGISWLPPSLWEKERISRRTTRSRGRSKRRRRGRV